MAQAQMDLSSPRCFRGKEIAKSLQCCLTFSVWDCQMLQDTGAWDNPISQGLALFQAVLGHLVKSTCEFLPEYYFPNVLHKSRFSICRWPTLISSPLLPVPHRELQKVRELTLIEIGTPNSPVVPVDYIYLWAPPLPSTSPSFSLSAFKLVVVKLEHASEL